MTVKRVLPLLGVLGLAACSGGGGGSTGGAPTLGQLYNEAADLTASLPGVDPATTLPGSGTAQYEGIIVLKDAAAPAMGSGDGFIGDVFLQATFTGGGAGSVSGTAGGFFTTTVDGSGNPGGAGSSVGGSLNISSTTFGPDADGMEPFTGITASVTGDLDVDDDGSTNAISGSVEGSIGDEQANDADFIILGTTGAPLSVTGSTGFGSGLDAAIIAEDR